MGTRPKESPQPGLHGQGGSQRASPEAQVRLAARRQDYLDGDFPAAFSLASNAAFFFAAAENGLHMANEGQAGVQRFRHWQAGD
jgi:hypothetical protein